MGMHNCRVCHTIHNFKHQFNDNPDCHLEIACNEGLAPCHLCRCGSGGGAQPVRALRLWLDFPDEFRKLVVDGIRCGYSWNRPGADYLSIYDCIRHK